MSTRFTPAQSKLFNVQIILQNGEMRTLEMMKIQLDYVDMVLDGHTLPNIEAQLGVNKHDVDNWNKEYSFNKYLEFRREGRGWANTLTHDFVCAILGKAAMGKIDLSNSQLNSIKLLMQAQGIIKQTGATRKKEDVSSFTISEKEATDGE